MGLNTWHSQHPRALQSPHLSQPGAMWHADPLYLTLVPSGQHSPEHSQPYQETAASSFTSSFPLRLAGHRPCPLGRTQPGAPRRCPATPRFPRKVPAGRRRHTDGETPAGYRHTNPPASLPRGAGESPDPGICRGSPRPRRTAGHSPPRSLGTPQPPAEPGFGGVGGGERTRHSPLAPSPLVPAPATPQASPRALGAGGRAAAPARAASPSPGLARPRPRPWRQGASISSPPASEGRRREAEHSSHPRLKPPRGELSRRARPGPAPPSGGGGGGGRDAGELRRRRDYSSQRSPRGRAGSGGWGLQHPACTGAPRP